MPLPLNDIESELSYAYLHAVATAGGLNCKYEKRHGDNYGVDALIDYYAPIEGTYRTDVTLRIQLKATKNKQAESATHISYYFKGIEQYNRMRSFSGEPHRILAVLFLPQNPSDWLSISPTELAIKDAAYWVSLIGAPASVNDSGETIYLPKSNLLTTDSLINLCQEIGRGKTPIYQMP